MLLLLHYWGRTWVGDQAVCTLTLPILHFYTGAMMRDLTVEQYHMVYPEWNGLALNWPRGEVSSEFHTITQEEKQNTPQNTHCHSSLVSNYTILFM